MAKLKTENESVANTFHSFVCVAPPPPPCFIITPLFCETLLTVEKQRVAYMRWTLQVLFVFPRRTSHRGTGTRCLTSGWSWSSWWAARTGLRTAGERSGRCTTPLCGRYTINPFLPPTPVPLRITPTIDIQPGSQIACRPSRIITHCRAYHYSISAMRMQPIIHTSLQMQRHNRQTRLGCSWGLSLSNRMSYVCSAIYICMKLWSLLWFVPWGQWQNEREFLLDGFALGIHFDGPRQSTMPRGQNKSYSCGLHDKNKTWGNKDQNPFKREFWNLVSIVLTHPLLVLPSSIWLDVPSVSWTK